MSERADNIPQWARSLTEEVLEAYVNTDMTVDDAIFVAVFNAIHEARSEAYEECAKVAEDDDGDHTIFGEDRNTRVAQMTARAIAAAIRSKANLIQG